MFAMPYERQFKSNRKVRFPSLSERLTADLLRIYAPIGCFEEVPSYRIGEDVLPGLTYLHCKESKVYFQITSEILGARYPEKLCIENILYALEQINTLDGVCLDPELILEYGMVSEVHVTDDLYLSHSPRVYLNTLRCIPIPENVDRPPAKRGSVVFASRNKDKRHSFYLTVYDKYLEFRTSSLCDSSVFRDITRIELKLRTAQMIKKRLRMQKREPPTLREVLECTVPVNAELLREVWQYRDIEIPQDEWIAERYRREFNDLTKEYATFDGVVAYLRARLPASTARRWIKTYGSIVNSDPDVFRPMEEILETLLQQWYS